MRNENLHYSVTSHFNSAMKLLSTTTLIFILFSCQTQSKKLDSKIQTVEFHYIMWACECANWATLEDINKYQDPGKLSDYCVFVEPADSSLVLPDTLGYSSDIVQFTGQYYVDKGKTTTRHLQSNNRQTAAQYKRKLHKDFLSKFSISIPCVEQANVKVIPGCFLLSPSQLLYETA